eukprot:3117048-Rhodomonas_salina.1
MVTELRRDQTYGWRPPFYPTAFTVRQRIPFRDIGIALFIGLKAGARKQGHLIQVELFHPVEPRVRGHTNRLPSGRPYSFG